MALNQDSNNMEKQVISLEIPKEMLVALDSLAKKDFRSRNSFILKLISDALGDVLK